MKDILSLSSLSFSKGHLKVEWESVYIYMQNISWQFLLSVEKDSTPYSHCIDFEASELKQNQRLAT